MSGRVTSQGWRLFRIAGIPLYIHPSWLLVLPLATLAFLRPLGGHAPEALVTALLLFGSVLLHELGHSLAALRLGVPVRSITLFMLGGVATIEREPRTAFGSLQVAVAGPLVSLGLALLFGLSIHAISHLQPLLGLMAEELARLNLLLALFNLLPGLPLDGGQILQALVWQVSGSRERGVRVSGACGRLLAWMIMSFGLLLLFRGGSIDSLWLVLIGWFLLGASRSQLQLLTLQKALKDLRVRDAAGRRLRVLEPSASLRALSQLRLSSDNPRPDWVLLCDGGRWRGWVDDGALRQVPVQRWDHETLLSQARPLDSLPSIPEGAPLWQAVLALEDSPMARLLVVSPAGLPTGTLERPEISEAVLTRLALRLPVPLLEQARRQGTYPMGFSLASIARSIAALPEATELGSGSTRG